MLQQAVFGDRRLSREIAFHSSRLGGKFNVSWAVPYPLPRGEGELVKSARNRARINASVTARDQKMSARTHGSSARA